MNGLTKALCAGVAGLLCLSFAAGGWAAAGSDSKEQPAPREVVFKKIGDVELKMHIYEPAGHSAQDQTPAIVFFFGGGWTGGTPRQFFPHCEYLASRGMVAMSAEYRVKSKHQTTPFECVKDGKSAVRWIRAHAAELGVDPKLVAAGGGSAGGHVAACTGVIDGLEEEGEDAKVSARPAALALFNPVADTTKLGYGASKVGPEPEKISPAHHVNKGDPPTIIFHGKADTTVPFENVERFAKRMKEAGNRCELVPYADQKHGFFNYGRSKDNQNFIDTVRKMDEFLISLGYLKGKPTIETWQPKYYTKAPPKKKKAK
jgi:acetyl esterase